MPRASVSAGAAPVRRRLGRALGLALALTAAAACSSDNPVRSGCPAIRIPADTERLTRFAEGGARDITDMRLQAGVTFLSGECEIEEEVITMTFPIAVRAERGPANDDGVSEVELFMAVTKPDRTILTRRALPITLRFPGNRTDVVASETISIEIPKKPEQTVDDFLVFLGFKLERAELEFNRSDRSL